MKMFASHSKLLLGAAFAAGLFISTAARADETCVVVLFVEVCTGAPDAPPPPANPPPVTPDPGTGETDGAPEPITLAGLGIAGAGLAWAKRRRASRG